jgi:phosphatidylserine decarboxylase
MTNYEAWAFVYRANLEEIEKPLNEYPSLQDFFTRQLKDGSRPICTQVQGMASPCDGKVVIFGEITSDQVEQVKGRTYSLSGFLGMDWKTCKTKANSKLYHVVLYLAPGDYHRFHSPTDWIIGRRRHFPGTILLNL